MGIIELVTGIIIIIFYYFYYTENKIIKKINTYTDSSFGPENTSDKTLEIEQVKKHQFLKHNNIVFILFIATLIISFCIVILIILDIVKYNNTLDINLISKILFGIGSGTLNKVLFNLYKFTSKNLKEM